MSVEDCIKEYEKASARRQEAESWVSLLKERDSQSGHPFIASAAHSVVKLMICGQKYAGAANYHESPKPFNDALAEVLCANMGDICNQAIAHLCKIEASKAEAAASAADELAEQCRSVRRNLT